MDPGKLVENLKSTLFTNAIGGLGSILGSGTRSESESGTTDSVITGAAVGLGSEHRINNGTISVDDTPAGAITRPGESLADSITREAELNAALAAASAAVATTIGDLFTRPAKDEDGNILRDQNGQVVYKQTVSNELKSILHGATQAGLAAIAGGDALTAGLSAAVSDLLSPVIQSTLWKKRVFDEDNKQLTSLASALIGAGIGAITGDAALGSNIAYTVDRFNQQLHPKLIEKLMNKEFVEGYIREKWGLTKPTCIDGKVCVSAKAAYDSP